ncbi:MAG TPA: SDR family NAD(P)-dependent oxidoreductase [Candidatus Limnocylindria bacterium]
MRLADRTIIITGGGHGIGRAYAHRCAQEGANVVVADIDGPAAAAVAKAVGTSGARSIGIAADVRHLAEMEDVVRAAEEQFGGVDGLINNAGMLTIIPISRVGFESIDEAEWDAVLETNLKGTWLACRATVPAMRRRGGGSIVNIGSGTFFLGSPTRAHYVASKGGVIGLSRVLSRELADANVRVNVIVPGSTLSEDDPSDDIIRMRSGPVPNRSIRRIEVPQDLTGTAVFFLSDDSAFITGQTLVVEGGGILH